jgi:hypothetical protein
MSFSCDSFSFFNKFSSSSIFLRDFSSVVVANAPKVAIEPKRFTFFD